MELEHGATYYRVTYADSAQTMPGIEPMVYIGDDLFDDEKESKHYFQDTTSILRYGPADKIEITGSSRVFGAINAELGTDIVDIEGAAELVTKAASQFNKLGKPKLQRLTGGWTKTSEPTRDA